MEEAKLKQAERDECKKRWLLHPTQPAKVAWDSVMAVLVIYSVLIVPVRVGFGVEAAKGGAWEFEVIVDFLFLFDVVVNFRSSYRYALYSLARRLTLSPTTTLIPTHPNPSLQPQLTPAPDPTTDPDPDPTQPRRQRARQRPRAALGYHRPPLRAFLVPH